MSTENKAANVLKGVAAASLITFTTGSLLYQVDQYLFNENQVTDNKDASQYLEGKIKGVRAQLGDGIAESAEMEVYNATLRGELNTWVARKQYTDRAIETAQFNADNAFKGGRNEAVLVFIAGAAGAGAWALKRRKERGPSGSPAGGETRD